MSQPNLPMKKIPMPLKTTHVAKQIELSQWQIQSTSANQISSPDQLNQLTWNATQVPGTVAQHLFKTTTQPGDFEALDWWYFTEFDLDADVDLNQVQILFEGLATITEIWLNHKKVAQHENMFLPLALQHDFKSGTNQLHLCFRSLSNALIVKRPRPAWKTPLVEQQQLRWFRTSLLGRMYGWTQPWPIVGPWRAVQCFVKAPIFLRERQLLTELKNSVGILRANFVVESQSKPTGILSVLGKKIPVAFIQLDGNDWRADIECEFNQVPVWWPHTHGEPNLVDVNLVLETENTSAQFDLGKIGFKQLALNRSQGQLAFVVNGVEIFSRGATWTTDDVVSLFSSREQLKKNLQQAQEAGLNMLRLNGTMFYESDDFFELCDELGILVWQDFMFACMDYPTQDPQFGASVDAETIYHIHRQSSHICVAAYCGSNEIQMQAMMVGLPASGYASDFFDRRLPEFCNTYHPGIPYFVSSPCEGELPFQPQIGTSHYYGVGAFRQPLADAEISQVKFATECLAFSNIPENKNLDLMFAGKLPYMHSPEWKIGVPRMASSGYDFEDVRDFYLKEMFDIDAMQLRAYDTRRYIEYSRIAMMEITEKTLALWRSNYTMCSGALLFFWRDLYLGAGWGAVDNIGDAKSVYYAWKRACQSRVIFLIPRGMNGLTMELINETAQPQNWRIELKAYNHLDVETINVSHLISLNAREQKNLTVDSLIGHFTDLPHAFRFGPVQHQVVHARLYDVSTHELLGEDFFFPKLEFLPHQKQDSVEMSVQEIEPGTYDIHLKSKSLLQWAKLDIPQYQLSNNYFHLTPNNPVVVRAKSTAQVVPQLKGYLEAINLAEAQKIRV